MIPLRPLGIGEILDGAVSSIRAHPRAMLGFSALLVAASEVLQALLVGSALSELASRTSVAVTATPDQLVETLVRGLPAMGVAIVVSFLAQLLLTGVLTVVVSRAVLGRSISVQEAWATARPQLGRLFSATLVYGLLLVAAILVPFLPLVVVVLGGGPAALVALLGFAGFLVAVAVLSLVVVRYALLAPVVVLERQPVRNALRRAPRLVERSFWRVLGILLLTQVLVIIVGLVVGVPFSVAATSIAGDDPFGALPLTITTIGGVLAGTLTYPFAAAVTALLYVDQRMRREGLDITLARAAADDAAGPREGGWAR